MRFKPVVLGALSLALALGGAQAALSQVVDGLAAMHDMRREGGRLCFTDHFHYGNSAGLRSKRAAEAAAIASWRDFTAFEYGSAWANYRKSASKQMKCSKSSGGWACDVSSRPCR